jgi:glycosyltransferase involved in cell wall biosynthesis
MVNNNRNKNNKLSNDIKNKYPLVSLCTPTFNRRPFIPAMIKCFQHQDYPKNRIEWIIIDDGTDKIEDLIKHIPQVKYFKYDKKMSLGEKRNLMHDKSSGDILVYMDDDDYYPPERISHAVQKLKENPNALCAGSSIIYIWFKHINKMWQFGPYGPNHATAGTFAFRRELLNITRYDNNAALAEEKAFLKNYTIPFVQLDPLKSILCFSHEHNTFDKKKLLEMPNIQFSKSVELLSEQIIKDKELLDFYKYKIEDLLRDYEPGRPIMKPDVLKQMEEIEKERQAEIEKCKASNNKSSIMLQQPGKSPIILSNDEVIDLLSNQSQEVNRLINIIQMKDKFIELMKNKLLEKDELIVILNKEKELYSNSYKNEGVNVTRVPINDTFENIQIRINETEAENENENENENV